MSLYTIKNEILTVSISNKGAEIKSIKSAKGTEFIWHSDPKFWSGSAPTLFPICGGLKDDKYILNGSEYTLKKHGFARNSEFTAEVVTENQAVFLLKSNADTLAAYPFEFELRIIYTLDKNSLNVGYSVKNMSNDKMYFSIGAHEAYLCPNGIEEYKIEFEKNENLYSYPLNGNLLEDRTVTILENSSVLPLKYDYFAIDALVFKNTVSKSVRLIGEGKSIKVDFNGFDYLLLWTKPGAPYMCIEPWCGIPDGVDSDYDITKKEGILTVDAKGEYKNCHTITFSEDR